MKRSRKASAMMTTITLMILRPRAFSDSTRRGV
jgi:hypothetical protein